MIDDDDDDGFEPYLFTMNFCLCESVLFYEIIFCTMLYIFFNIFHFAIHTSF